MLIQHFLPASKRYSECAPEYMQDTVTHECLSFA